MWQRIDDWLAGFDCDDIERAGNGDGPRSRLRCLWAPPAPPEFEEDTDDQG